MIGSITVIISLLIVIFLLLFYIEWSHELFFIVFSMRFASFMYLLITLSKLNIYTVNSIVKASKTKQNRFKEIFSTKEINVIVLAIWALWTWYMYLKNLWSWNISSIRYIPISTFCDWLYCLIHDTINMFILWWLWWKFIITCLIISLIVILKKRSQ